MSQYNIQLKQYNQPEAAAVEQLIKRPTIKKDHLEEIIDKVFTAVKEEGDKAIIDLTEQFDGVRLEELPLSESEIQRGIEAIGGDLKEAIDTAFENILRFHKAQKTHPERIETTDGVVCWREERPIQKVGLYIPGGTAPLFSTVLMLGIPALVAGCQEVVLCTPPSKLGIIHPAIIYAADKCGIRTIVRAGGAQAIAGMVLGTESIPSVYKVFGPGNQFVTAAKMRGLNHGVAIDLPAGPSEVLIYADQTARPDFIAADLLSQAEHGIDSQVVLVTTDESIVPKVNRALNEQLASLSRSDTAILSLAHAFACVFESADESFAFINEYAPEHLILSADDAGQHLEKIQNAGSVFIGHYTPESAGDYASGTNHTLPTAANARAYSGVSLDSFTKKITFQEISKSGIQNLGPAIITMAKHEELTAHAQAVQLRLDTL